MLQITIDNGQGVQDYTSYVDPTSIQITDGINVPTIIKMTVINNDDGFVMPVRNAYVTIYSRQYQKVLATGFVTQTPQASYLGEGGNLPSFGFHRYNYDLLITSDEWLLNTKSIPFIPAFINQTYGQILANLANTLLPGYFDTQSFIQDGDRIPYYLYDPTQQWGQIAKVFADAVRFRYKVINRTIYFEPYGDSPLGISYDDTNPRKAFDPGALQTSVLSQPIVNDVIIVGDVEARNIRDDYFIGDGATGNFPLRHKCFHGSSNLLINETWNEQQFSTNMWTVFDPAGAFNLSSALNIIGGTGVLGEDYILSVNGIELGGSVNLQHGECLFDDSSTGIIGGLYNDPALQYGNCLVGFDIRPSTNVITTASGASGIYIQPILSGAQVGPRIVTQANHHYQLSTLITSTNYARYNRTFRSLGGQAFGGNLISSISMITWIIADVNMAVFNTPVSPLIPVAPANITQYTLNVTLPSFMLYAPVNIEQFNATINFTSVGQPPLGTLGVRSLIGATGAQNPIVTPGPEQGYVLGFGYENATATIGQSGDVDQLQFYQDDIPSVGSRIRLQTWEAGHALSRVQDPASIAAEAITQGDNGVRSAVITQLQPLPRTSEECEFASQAFLADRTQQQYDGSYQVTNLFQLYWNGYRNDYPVSGRFLPVHSPERGITNQQFLVSQVVITVNEIYQEVLTFQITFGQDTYLNKLLRQFVPPTQPPLIPQDTANPPLPQAFQNVGLTYLPDLSAAFISNVHGGSIDINLNAFPITGCEIRRQDLGWGINDQNLIAVVNQQLFTLARSAIDQTYYLRQVNNGIYSRFAKVFRIYYPLTPLAPLANGLDLTDPNHPVVYLGLNGDIRNIRGIEIRDTDNVTVLYQNIFLTLNDLIFTADNSVTKARVLNYYCYFFNLMFEYSPSTEIVGNIPAPNAPVIQVLSAMSQIVNILLDNPGRSDIAYTSVQMADDPSFATNLVSVTGGGSQSVFNLQLPQPVGVPAVRDQYIRASRNDILGQGPWSTPIVVSAEDFLSSGYLNAQSSVVPIVTSQVVNLFNYTSTDTSIAWFWGQFTLTYPDGEEQIVQAGSYLANTGLGSGQTYYFYPYIVNAYEINPQVVVAISLVAGGTAPDPSLTIIRQSDGNISLSLGSMLASTTNSGTGTGGGGGNDL